MRKKWLITVDSERLKFFGNGFLKILLVSMKELCGKPCVGACKLHDASVFYVTIVMLVVSCFRGRHILLSLKLRNLCLQMNFVTINVYRVNTWKTFTSLHGKGIQQLASTMYFLFPVFRKMIGQNLLLCLTCFSHEFLHRRRNRGGTGGTCPPRFCNKQRSALFISRKCLLFIKEKVPSKCRAPPSLRCFLRP